jgi:hypothetical protein
MYGKIISSKDMMPVSVAHVYMYIDDQMAVSLFKSWKNPVYISERDEGIFSFFPMPIEARPPFKKVSFCIKITINSDGADYDKAFSYEVSPVLINNLDINLHENVIQLEDIYIPNKSFLP